MPHLTAPIPRYLYKYREYSINDGMFVDQIVRHGEFWCAHPLSFNDPFDSQIPVKVRGGKRKIEQDDNIDLIAFGGKFMRRHYGDVKNWPVLTPEIERAIRDEFESETGATRDQRIARLLDDGHNGCDFGHGVLSLTEDPVNILMWSHYSANHTGVAIRINTCYLDDVYRNALIKVRYTNRFPSPVMASRYDEFLPIDKLFGYKAKHWSYEKEWRYVSSNVGVVRFGLRAIDGVILGCKCPETAKTQLCTVIETRKKSEAPATIMQAEMIDGCFALRLSVLGSL